MRKVIEGVVVVLISSALSVAIREAVGARGGAGAAWRELVLAVAPVQGPAWWLAGLTGLGAVALAWGRGRRRSELEWWELDFHLPSPVVILLAAATACCCTALAIRLATAESVWALPPACVAAWLVARAVHRFRRALRMAGL